MNTPSSLQTQNLSLMTSTRDFAEQHMHTILARLAGPQRFHTLSYTDAVVELQKAAASGASSFDFPAPAWGDDLAAEHERWLVDCLFGGHPVLVTDWRAGMKAEMKRV